MKVKKLAILLLVVAMIGVFAVGCGSSSDSGSAGGSDTAATSDAGGAAPGKDAGFTEYPITDDNEQEVEVAEGSKVNVAGVYFQPVDLEPAGDGLAKADADIHIEADISASDNNLGYGVGDWIPYMTVDYKVLKAGTEDAVSEGTFMVMNATDGPHYGANIKLPDAGTYDVQFSLHSPAENGFVLHVDKETGVEGRFWDKPVTVTFKDWDYAGPVTL